MSIENSKEDWTCNIEQFANGMLWLTEKFLSLMFEIEKVYINKDKLLYLHNGNNVKWIPLYAWYLLSIRCKSFLKIIILLQITSIYTHSLRCHFIACNFTRSRLRNRRFSDNFVTFCRTVFQNLFESLLLNFFNSIEIHLGGAFLLINLWNNKNLGLSNFNKLWNNLQ